MLAGLLRTLTVATVLAYAALLMYLVFWLRIDFRLDGPLASALPHLPGLIQQLRPVLEDLGHQNFFRYFRVDISRECPFRVQDALCTARANCQLTCECPIDRLPKTWLQEDLRARESQAFSPITLYDVLKPHVNGKDPWSFDLPTANSTYVDLLTNKEQYTGYQGQNIWRMIYEENCPALSLHCGENNLLSRVLSGMHASVSSHLSEYFIDFGRDPSTAFPNELLYFQKVGAHPERLRNLVFAVEVLLRAYVRYVDLIGAFAVDTGEFGEDMKTKDLLARLTSIVLNVKDEHFEGLGVFGAATSPARQREAYQQYFSNITQVMDCVDCVKCRVYGKMQILGVGVALRILLKEKDVRLTRNELVAFVNTLNKWTESLAIVERMRDRLAQRRIAFALYLTAAVGVLLAILAALHSLARRRQRHPKLKDQ